jgi:hypothetical protein
MLPYLHLTSAAGALGALALHAPALAAQPAAPTEHRFPSISATALSGRKFSLPKDLEGEVNLVLVAFAREQQALVDGWLPTAKLLAAELPGLRYYEMPTIGRGFVLIRPIISNGMRGGVTAQADREATITLYTNVDAFRRALALPSEDTIYALLLDRTGTVRWRGEGTFTEAQGASLRAAAARLLDPAKAGADAR